MAPVDNGELQTVLANDLGIKLFVLRNPLHTSKHPGSLDAGCSSIQS
jgi:hypothetical protein